MYHFKLYKAEDINNKFSVRNGETKLGEQIEFVKKIDDLRQLESSIVILGIPESYGPRANYGKYGAENAWQAFLNAFLNIQHNSFISDKKIVLLGAFDLKQLETSEESINQLRKTTQEIDDLVYPLIHTISESGHTPIVIGGGHNNCYPIIKGVSMAKKEAIQSINIDPHADFRVVEGRHSGNGFSYAFNDGLLDKYHVFGLHENYNSQYIINTLIEKLRKAIEFFGKQSIGIEIDLDCILNMPSSAFTPSGFSVEEVRKILNVILKSKSANYLHICEGAPNDNKEALIVGKTISYLVSDFIKHYWF